MAVNEAVQEEVKKIFRALKSLYEEEEGKKAAVKSIQDFLRESIADELGIVKGTGEPDKSKIKTRILKIAIEVLTEERNRLEEEMELLEQYLKILEKKDEDIDDYLRHAEELQEVKDEIKEQKKVLKSLLGGDTMMIDFVLAKAKNGSVALPPEEKIQEIKKFLEEL